MGGCIPQQACEGQRTALGVALNGQLAHCYPPQASWPGLYLSAFCLTEGELGLQCDYAFELRSSSLLPTDHPPSPTADFLWGALKDPCDGLFQGTCWQPLINSQ